MPKCSSRARMRRSRTKRPIISAEGIAERTSLSAPRCVKPRPASARRGGPRPCRPRPFPHRSSTRRTSGPGGSASVAAGSRAQRLRAAALEEVARVAVAAQEVGDFGGERFIVAALAPHERAALVRGQRARARRVRHAAEAVAHASPASSRCSHHARANAQSVFTVAGEMPSACAVSLDREPAEEAQVHDAPAARRAPRAARRRAPP